MGFEGLSVDLNAPSENGEIMQPQTQQMTTVVLPYQLRRQTGGARSVEVHGETVRDLIRALDERCPGLKFSICLETGELRPFVNVFVGREDIRYLAGLDT